MKARIKIALFLILSIPLYANLSQDDIPNTVLESAKLVYPNTKIRKWEVKEQQYYAYVKNQGRQEIARFFTNGEWIETKISTLEDELPAEIHSFLEESYAAYTTVDRYYIEKKKGKPCYALTLRLKSNKTIRTELLFDLSGKIMQIDGLSVLNAENEETIEAKHIGGNEIIAPEILAVPQAVRQTFYKKFVRAENETWRKENGFHLVVFFLQNTQREACLAENGQLVYIAQFFDKNNSPLPIERYLSEEYPKGKIEECKRVVYESSYKRLIQEKPKDYYRVIIAEKIPKTKKIKRTLILFDQSAQFDMKMDYDEKP